MSLWDAKTFILLLFFCKFSIHSVTKCYRLTVLLLSHLVLFYQRADVLYWLQAYVYIWQKEYCMFNNKKKTQKRQKIEENAEKGKGENWKKV